MRRAQQPSAATGTKPKPPRHRSTTHKTLHRHRSAYPRLSAITRQRTPTRERACDSSPPKKNPQSPGPTGTSTTKTTTTKPPTNHQRNAHEPHAPPNQPAQAHTNPLYHHQPRAVTCLQCRQLRLVRQLVVLQVPSRLDVLRSQEVLRDQRHLPLPGPRRQRRERTSLRVPQSRHDVTPHRQCTLRRLTRTPSADRAVQLP